jgi:hypothetical protein
VSVFTRAVLLVFITVALLLAMMFFLGNNDARCPDGQVPVLSEDRWVCVKREG